MTARSPPHVYHAAILYWSNISNAGILTARTMQECILHGFAMFVFLGMQHYTYRQRNLLYYITTGSMLVM